MTEFLQRRKIKNQITDRDTYAWFDLFRLENSKWQVFQRKLRIGWDVDE